MNLKGKMVEGKKIQIHKARTRKEINSCFSVCNELRVNQFTKTTFIHQILRQNKQGYILAFIKEEGEVAACIGYHVFETLAWGKTLYIDDLITREKSRKLGYGTALIQHAIRMARVKKCKEVHLDTGHHRHVAHRFYFNLGFIIDCHHFALRLHG